MSKFQLVLLIVFGAFILLAVMIFSLTRASSTGTATVVVWGDIPSYDWNNFSNTVALSSQKDYVISYVEKPSDLLVQEFTEALAEGQGPDLIILSLDELWKQRNRLLPIPYENISERDFKATFIEAGELFLMPEGIYALPLVVDPLVLYYNRDLLSRAGIAEPLSFWDEMYAAASKLTVKDAAGNITKSVMALGEANNISNYKDILSLLLLQAGTPITTLRGGSSGPELVAALNYNPSLPTAPAEAALDFYTQFANPSKQFYSWNRSLLPAQTHFAAGDSAYYIGHASELGALRAKNPTLNLGVAPVPQSRVSERALSFADLKGVALTRTSRNPGAAFAVATKLVSRDSVAALAQLLVLPPVRRDLLSTRPADSVMSVFFEAALQSKVWLDPDGPATKSVFKEMIESVTSGRARTSEAVGRANRELENLTK